MNADKASYVKRHLNAALGNPGVIFVADKDGIVQVLEPVNALVNNNGSLTPDPPFGPDDDWEQVYRIRPLRTMDKTPNGFRWRRHQVVAKALRSELELAEDLIDAYEHSDHHDVKAAQLAWHERVQ